MFSGFHCLCRILSCQFYCLSFDNNVSFFSFWLFLRFPYHLYITIFLPSLPFSYHLLFSALWLLVLCFVFFFLFLVWGWLYSLSQWISAMNHFWNILRCSENTAFARSLLSYSYIELFDSHVSFALLFSLIFFPLCFSLDVFCWSRQDHKSCVFVFSQLQNWSTDFLISNTVFFNSKITIWFFFIAFNSLLKFPLFHLLWTFFCIFNLC